MNTSLDKSAFDSIEGWDGSFNLDNFLGDLGTFHMSPNKLGGHKVYATLATPIQEPIPEPTTLCLMGFGILGLLGFGIRQRRKGK